MSKFWSNLKWYDWLFCGLVTVVLFIGIRFVAHHDFKPVYIRTATYCGADNKFCWDEQDNRCNPSSNFQFGFGGNTLRGTLRSCK